MLQLLRGSCPSTCIKKQYKHQDMTLAHLLIISFWWHFFFQRQKRHLKTNAGKKIKIFSCTSQTMKSLFLSVPITLHKCRTENNFSEHESCSSYSQQMHTQTPGMQRRQQKLACTAHILPSFHEVPKLCISTLMQSSQSS